MIDGCENIRMKSLQSQNDFVCLPLPKIANLTGSQITYETTADKAGLLFDESTPVGSRSLAREGGPASLLYTIANFFRTMPKTEKVSAGAPGASTATVSARKRASKPVQAKPIKRYYQVTIYAKRGDLCVANLHCSYPFLATSREDAIGMACDLIRYRWPKYMIVAEDIQCTPIRLANYYQ